MVEMGVVSLKTYVFFVGLTAGALSCSISKDGFKPTKADNVKHSEYVLYGLVLETYPHPDFESAYSVLMQVYCVLKGNATADVVNISEAGHIPGMCGNTELEQGKEYVALLYYGNHGQGQERLGALHSYPQTDLQEVAQTCGLIPRYPDGITSSTYDGKQCPLAADPETCLSPSSVQRSAYGIITFIVSFVLLMTG